MNILFIMTDQQSADLMSCVMGTDYLSTPGMDAIAEKGTRFTRAYTANPLCCPARNAIFTGHYPHTTGVQANTQDPLDIAELPLMGTRFRAAGYDTGYFGKWHINTQMTVNAAGFETMAVNQNKGFDHEIAEPTVEFMTRDRNSPFIAVASFSNPHDICQMARKDALPNGEVGDAPPPAQCPPAPANLAPPADESDTMAMARRSYHATRAFPVGDYTVDDWRQLRWGYYRLIEKVDTEIGKVLAALKTHGLEQNTVVVFTSDHGDCAGAHRFNQKTVFYEESVRVPLIISHPGSQGRATSDRLISTGIDLLPTLLDVAGIAPDPELRGQSIKGVLFGSLEATERDYVVAENHMTQGGPVDGRPVQIQGRMVRSKQFKYCIYDSGQQREELFDLARDPGETMNLANNPDYVGVLAEHRAFLGEHGTRTADVLANELLADGVPARPF